MSRSFEENNAVVEVFTDALGMYIAATATNESMFLSFLVLIMRDASDAPLAIWFQSQSTRARLEIVRNICRAKHGNNSDLTRAVSDFIARFKGLTRQRNFYAHCIYDPQENGTVKVRGYEIVEGDNVIKQVEKKITKGICNEIHRAVHQLDTLNLEMWEFIDQHQNMLIGDGVLEAPLLPVPKPLS